MVDRDLVQFSNIVLLSSNTTTAVMKALEGSVGDSGFSTVLNVFVGEDNLNNIKANTSLASGRINTFLNLLTNAIEDVSGNVYSDEITIFQVSQFLPDVSDLNSTLSV